MNLVDVIIIVAVVGAVAAIMIKKVRDKKAGKSSCSCGCDCSGCSDNKHCH